MRMFETPPAGWDSRIPSPVLSRGFATASEARGRRALYVEDAEGQALVLVRRLTVPGLTSWTARAKAYVGRGDAAFVDRLVGALAPRGIAHAPPGGARGPLSPR